MFSSTANTERRCLDRAPTKIHSAAHRLQRRESRGRAPDCRAMASGWQPSGHLLQGRCHYRRNFPPLRFTTGQVKEPTTGPSTGSNSCWKKAPVFTASTPTALHQCSCRPSVSDGLPNLPVLNLMLTLDAVSIEEKVAALELV